MLTVSMLTEPKTVATPPTPMSAFRRRLPTLIATMSQKKTSGLKVAILIGSTAMTTAWDASLIPSSDEWETKAPLKARRTASPRSPSSFPHFPFAEV
jgi:hypothetical protein